MFLYYTEILRPTVACWAGRIAETIELSACSCSCLARRNEEDLGKLQHSLPPPGQGPVQPDKLVNGASSGTSSEEPSPIRRMPSELPVIKEAPVVGVVPGVKEQVTPLCLLRQLCMVSGVKEQVAPLCLL